MPLYEYECTVCKHRFDLLQKFSDEPAKICVQCGAPVVRLLSSPAIQFKGTGWYVTDYGGKSAASTASNKESQTESSSEKSTPASTETTAAKETSTTSASSSSTEKGTKT